MRLFGKGAISVIRILLMGLVTLTLCGCIANPADRRHLHSEILIDDGLSERPHREAVRRPWIGHYPRR